MKRAFNDIAGMMHRADPSAQFAFEFWDGERIVFGDDPKAVLRLKTKECARDILRNGFLGFGEGYVAGDVEVEGDFQELLRLGFAIEFDEVGFSLLQRLRLLPTYLRSRSTQRQAPKNITLHYDLGDDFYGLYLDKTMTYSCAYFRNCSDSLEEAQLSKYEHIARKLMLSPGETLVDVGCGWGGMLIHAARKYGIKGLGNTLSKNQYEYANRKIRELGLQNQVEVVLADYRELTGTFDKFVSIGMFEHVGQKFIPVYMQKVSGLLKKGGLGLLHTIGKDVASLCDPWTQKYIFPGSHIPSLSEIVHQMGRTGFSILDVENLRMHYARTLDHWAQSYEKNVNRVREMFGESFARMWRLYLNGCAAGFKYGDSRLYQVLFSNGLNNLLPMTRAHHEG